METGMKLLGSDKGGNLYFWIIEPKGTGTKDFVVKVNIEDNTISIMKIDDMNWTMQNSSANSSNRFLRIDRLGNVNQLEMDYDGFRIKKYSFE
ncbi:hypothetical protein [Acetivibrio cellulolyticus]|uniref:hypothetical protein n=1 Tax=Acetivibrio cellulolyticus TaxID=35830 RepID=UPI0002481C79|nr:hypothetical protein [Acetivibrio cellulolyticus]